MKGTFRKTAILLSIGMMLVLLTPCARQTCPEVFAETGTTLDDMQQLSQEIFAEAAAASDDMRQLAPENNGEQTANPDENENKAPKDAGNTSGTSGSSVSNTVDMLRNLKDKAVSSSDTSVDREQIQKEIEESTRQLDENALLNFKDKFLDTPEQRLQQAAASVKEIKSRNELQGSEKLESKLKEIQNRHGVKLDIESADEVKVSFVAAGKTYTTTAAAKAPEGLQQLFEHNYQKEPSPDDTAKGQVGLTAGGVGIGIDAAATTVFSIDTNAGLTIKATTVGSIDVSPVLVTLPKGGQNTDADQILSQFTDKVSASGGGSNTQNSEGSLTIGSGPKRNPNPQGSENSIIVGTSSVISQGQPEIVFGIGGLAAFIVAVLIFRKRNIAPVTDKEKHAVTRDDN